jgi:hypothetical protein
LLSGASFGMVRGGKPEVALHRRRFAWAAVAISSLTVSIFACSGEGEGQRCDLRDPPGADNRPGSSDCASGLTCYQASTLSGAGATYGGSSDKDTIGVCCPSSRSATDPVTICAQSSGGYDAGVPLDSGATDSAATDTSTFVDAPPGDAGSSDVSAPGDAAPDVAADAPAPADAAGDASGD